MDEPVLVHYPVALLPPGGPPFVKHQRLLHAHQVFPLLPLLLPTAIAAYHISMRVAVLSIHRNTFRSIMSSSCSGRAIIRVWGGAKDGLEWAVGEDLPVFAGGLPVAGSRRSVRARAIRILAIPRAEEIPFALAEKSPLCADRAQFIPS